MEGVNYGVQTPVRWPRVNGAEAAATLTLLTFLVQRKYFT